MMARKSGKKFHGIAAALGDGWILRAIALSLPMIP